MAVLLPNGKQQFFTTPGVPAVGYKLMTWAAGTSTPQATWADALKIAANPNPIILDGRGEAVIFWDGAYKIQLLDATGAPVSAPVDNVQSQQNTFSVTVTPTVTNSIDLGSPALSWRSGYFATNLYLGPSQAPAFDPVSGNIGYYARTLAEIAAGITPVNFWLPPLTVDRYGMNTAPGTTDMTAAIMAAVAVAQASANGGVIQYLAAQYLVGSAGTFVAHTTGNIMHKGTSRESTIIVNGSTNHPAIAIGNGLGIIYGGGITSMFFTQKTGVVAVVGNTAFTFNQVGQFLVRDVLISNFLGAPFRGAYFTGPSYNNGCSQCDIDNLQAQQCLDSGFTNVNGTDFYMVNSRSDANLNGGYVLNGSQGGYYQACTAFGNTGVAWFLSSTTPASAPNKNNFFMECVGDTSSSHNWQIGDSQNSVWVGCWGSTQGSPTVNTFACGFEVFSQNCTQLTFDGCVAVNNNNHGMQIFDTGASAPTAIIINGCNFASNGIAAGGGWGLILNGADNRIRVNGGYFLSNVTGAISNSSSGTDNVISANPIGYVTNNEGTGTITTTTTSVVINHGLGFTPTAAQIQIWPTSSMAASGVNSLWADTFTATQFTAHTNAAVAGSNFTFAYRGLFHGT